MAKNDAAKVWKYFEKSDDGKRTICTLCRSSLAYIGSSTSSMRSHMKMKHKSHSLEADAPSSMKRQASLHEFQRSKKVLTPGMRMLIVPWHLPVP